MRQLSLLAWLCVGTVTLTAGGASPAPTDDPAEWIRQRRQLLDDRVVIAAINRNGCADVRVAGPLGQPGYYQIMYMPDWESEDNVAAFRVITGEKLNRRLSGKDIERVRVLFPESRVLSFEDAYGPDDVYWVFGPCYCPFAGHRDLRFDHGIRLVSPQ
jgi:hypothetical protein